MRLLVIPLLVLLGQSTAAFLTVNANVGASLRHSCGLYEEYRICGPHCPHTCDTLKDNICCEVKCIPGCFCKDGYMLLSNRGPSKCVPIDDCPKPGILMFEESSISVYESSNVIRIVVVRVNGSYGEVSVRWRIVFKSGLNYPEYAGRSGRLVFPDGVVRQVIEIPLHDNNIRGQDISFSIELYDATNKVDIDARQARSVLTIKDDDMKPGYLEFEISDYTIRENEQKRMVCVKRYDGLDGELRVKYKTISSSAIAGKDFQPITGELIFKEGVDIQHIYVPIINDDIREPEKFFEVELFDPVSEFGMINFRGMGSRKRAVVKIIDDDMKPGWFQLEKTNYEVLENIGVLRIGVLRVGGTDGQIKLRYKTVVKSAFPKADFVPVEGVLVFEESESKKYIEIQIVDNDDREQTETFEVVLFEPAAGPGVINFRNLGFQQSVTISILDDDMRPGYFELEKSSYTTRENAGILRIGVLRRGGTDGQIRVRYLTVVKTAQVSKDFIPVRGELVFEEGQSQKFIDVVIIDDDVREPTKFFEFKLIDPSPGTGVINFRGLGSLKTALVTITDDDMKPGYLEFEYPTYSIQENQNRRIVSVKRYGGTDGELRVKYKTISGSAIAGKDFVSVVGDLIFKEGVDTQNIIIPIVDDNIREPEKAFQIEIFDPTAEASVINFRGLGSKQRAIIKIIDDDMAPGYFELEKANYVISESIGTLKIAVLRLDGTDGLVRVHYRTIEKTAVVNSDFFPVNGELVFEEGEKIKYIDIQIIDDEVREPTKTFMVQLYDPEPGNGVINFRGLGSQLTTLITINDDDMRPGYLLFEFPSYTTPENARSKKVCVKRIEGTDGELRLKYKSISGTAVVGKDFMGVGGDLVFREGINLQCILVPIVNNNIREPDRTFELEIYDPTPGFGVINFRGLGSTKRTVIKIIDDDMRPGVFELEQPSFSVTESAGTIIIPVLRVGGTDGQIRVRYKTIQKTAQPSTDFLPVFGELVFEEGIVKKYIEINIVNDDVREPSEVFEIQLLDPTAGDGVINFRGLGTKKTASITIIDDDMRPGFLLFEYPSYSTPENAMTKRVCVKRTEGTDGDLRVKYKTISGTAVIGKDFMGVGGDLVFREGISVQCISVPIINNNIRQPDRTFELEIYDPTPGFGVINFRGLGSTRRTVIKIIDDDMTPGVFELEQLAFSVAESAGIIKVPVLRVGGADGEIRVKYKTIQKTAQSSTDFLPVIGELVFEEGITKKYIEVNIINDDVREPSEVFEVLLLDPSAGDGVINFRGLGAKQTASITIIDDDMKPGYLDMEKPSITVTEGVGTVHVTVIRLGGSDGLLKTKYRFVGISAQSSVDFVAQPGELIFNDGETRKTIPITILDDNNRESIETFRIELYDPWAPTGSIFFRKHQTIIFTQVVIIDNDMNPGVVLMDKHSMNVNENVGTAQINVIRTGGSDGNLVVKYHTIDGTATHGTDFIDVEGEIVFREGETRKTISIRILNDNIKEPVESFQVELIGLQSRQLGSVITTVVNIIDDDENPGVILMDKNSITVSENVGVAQVDVIRTGGSDGTLAVKYHTIDGTAKHGIDFIDTEGEIVFRDGETRKTISVRILNDNIKEPIKSFQLELFGIQGRQLGLVTTTIINIIDDDVEVRPVPQDIEIFFVRTIVRVKRSMGSARLHIRREGDHVPPVTIFLTTKDGTAKGGLDYRKTRGEVSFLENEIELTLEFRLMPSNQPGGEKNFFVEISRPSKGKVLPTGSVATVIIEDDAPQEISGRSEVSGGGSIGTSGEIKEQSWSVSSSYEFRGHDLAPSGSGQVAIPKCPVGMTFKLCAPTCPKSCQTMNQPEKLCNKKCVNACFCPDGYVIENLSTLKCILPTECPAFRSGSIIDVSAGLGGLSELSGSTGLGVSANVGSSVGGAISGGEVFSVGRSVSSRTSSSAGRSISARTSSSAGGGVSGGEVISVGGSLSSGTSFSSGESAKSGSSAGGSVSARAGVSAGVGGLLGGLGVGGLLGG